MSSDHPPFKRNEGFDAAMVVAFPKLLELKGDNRNGFVDFTRAVLHALGPPVKPYDVTESERRTCQ